MKKKPKLEYTNWQIKVYLEYKNGVSIKKLAQRYNTTYEYILKILNS